MITPSVHALGPALRRWRTLNRIKQEALASDLGVSQATLSRWENRSRIPEVREARRIATLLEARPTSASDRALAELVQQSATPVHLICDLTHQLIAVSATRAHGWTIGAGELIGSSLWRFATDGIRRGEAELGDHGWFEPFANDVTVTTERMRFPELIIPSGPIRYTRVALSDGRLARLVRPDVDQVDLALSE